MSFNNVFLIQPKIKEGQNVIPYAPPIGLGTIAEALEQANINYDVIDMQLGYSFSYLKKKIRRFKPDLIGMGMMTFHYKDTYQFIHKIRQTFPDVKIVIGGPHVMTVGTKFLDECKSVDFAIYGEGDETIIELCKSPDITTVTGIIYRDENDKAIFTGIRKPLENIDAIHFPRYKKFELDKYIDNFLPPKFQDISNKKINEKQISLFTSRGCPYSCIFCLHAFTRKWRGRSATSIADEIEYWYKKGYRQFPFVEDNFSLNKNRVYELATEIKKRELTGLKLSAPTGLRADAVDKEVLAAMKEMGFMNISFAVESASPRVLQLMKKGETIEVIEKAIRDALDLGYEVGLFFVIGTPGETIEDVKISIDFANKFPIDARFYSLIPYPNTELFDMVEKKGYFLYKPEEYLNSASLFISTVYSTPEIPAEERERLISESYMTKQKIRSKSYYTDYGVAGIIWSKVTFIILPIMTIVWNTSPSIYRFCVNIYRQYRISLAKGYKKKKK